MRPAGECIRTDLRIVQSEIARPAIVGLSLARIIESAQAIRSQKGGLAAPRLSIQVVESVRKTECQDRYANRLDEPRRPRSNASRSRP